MFHPAAVILLLSRAFAHKNEPRQRCGEIRRIKAAELAQEEMENKPLCSGRQRHFIPEPLLTSTQALRRGALGWLWKLEEEQPLL